MAKKLVRREFYIQETNQGWDVMGIVLGVDGYEYCHGQFFCKKYAEDILSDLNEEETRKQETAYKLNG